METTLLPNPVPDDSRLMVAPVIGTGHLTLETTAALSECSGFMGDLEYGTLLYVPDYDERVRRGDFEPVKEFDLEVLYCFMAERQYRFVRLDGDGDVIDGLPTYPWD